MKKIVSIILLILPGVSYFPLSFAAVPSAKVDVTLAFSVLNTGESVASLLTENYNKVVENCGAGKPAYLCSGITLRITSPAEGRFALDPSPRSVASGGVSFSWLRKDIKVNQLAWSRGNGFITFNKLDTPKDIDNNLDYLCYFPEDAGADYRADKGCGEHQHYPKESIQCQLQEVFTADQWLGHFNKNRTLARQCGFIISEKQNTYDPADSFYQGIKASVAERAGGFGGQNEIRTATWDTSESSGYPQKFPVQAFFYINQKDLNWAQYDQEFFYKKSGRWVPAIKLTLPSSPTEDAKFEYLEADQKISEL